MKLPQAQLGAFRYRNFRFYWLSQVVANVTSWMELLATGWLVLQLTNSPVLLGVNAFIQAIPILAFALLGGTIADRYGARIIDHSSKLMLVEMSDEEQRVEKLIDELRPLGIVELVRTGVVAMGQGDLILHQEAEPA